MKLPKQTQPINRSQSNIVGSRLTAYSGSLAAIHSSSFLCGPCKSAVKGLGSALTGMGCTAAVGAFEVACNAALDVESFGAAIPLCAAAGVALEAACVAGGGAVTQGMINQVASTACGWAC